MSDLFDTGHVAQLHEIQRARLRRGEPGIGPEVEELIRRLTSGGVAGKSDDLRVIGAKRLFDLGVGRELGIVDFEGYLETIPAIPETLLADNPEFPHLVLVEPRIGLARLCRLGGIDFAGDDNTFVPWSDEYRDSASPIWIRVQDGRKNRNRKVSDCRSAFAPLELGPTALQGVSAYLAHPEIVTDLARPDGHAVDLPGSVHRELREDAAYLNVRYGQTRLHWYWYGNASPDYGSASRRKAA